MKLSPYQAERLALQICVAVAASFTVWGGARGILAGVPGGADTTFGLRGPFDGIDTHYTYLSGVLMAIGVWLWASVPHIEKRARRFEILVSLVFTGGVFRLIRAITSGAIQDNNVLVALSLELVAAPLLLLWQRRIAAQYKAMRAAAKNAGTH